MSKPPLTMAQRMRRYERNHHYAIAVTDELLTLDGHWTTGETMRPSRLAHLLKLGRYRARVERPKPRSIES